MCRDTADESENPGSDRELDPAAPQRRLLIVDDEPGIVEVLQEVLGNSGYRVETANNGAKALNRIASQEYDLIISDLCMPEMSGEKLHAAIRENYPHMLDRIVFLTGDTVSPGSRSFLEKTGAQWLSRRFLQHCRDRARRAQLPAIPSSCGNPQR